MESSRGKPNKAAIGADVQPRSTAHAGPPRVINTDENPALAAAITQLKSEGRCATSVRHRRVKYLNN
jgi:transposase, IS6 family